MRVAVIGGGPSGLVTLKYLTQAQQFLACESVEARLFESQARTGGAFSARVYEDAEMVSSKQLTTFSDFRHPNEPDFLSATAYVRYLDDYCTAFTLWPLIHLKTRVTAVTRRRNGHTVVYETQNGHQVKWDCDAVAVCSGLHVEPNIPEIPGLKHVPRVIHSSQFKARKQFHSSKTVMIVGTGETGADISYLAVTTPNVETVVLCHRDGCHFAPKRNPGPVILPCLRKPNPKEPGIPIDVSRASMFDTAYVHNILKRNDTLLWEYYRIYIKYLLYIASGTTLGMDQWIGGISQERHHPSKIFFNKSIKVCPYISESYRPKIPGPRLWLYSLRSFFVQTPIADTLGRRVDIAPFPQRFTRKGIVEFTNNGRPEYGRMRERQIRPDMVVLCTGYKQSFPFFQASSREGDAPYPTPDCADVRHIWKREDSTIGFIGFVRPSLGAIPPLAELQAQLWIANLLSPQSIPRPLLAQDEHHYKLRSLPNARMNYGVDHESYAYQLALDMDSAPGLSDIWRLWAWRQVVISFKLLAIWIFGAHINTKFRLKGPWKWDGALEIFTSDEIWQTITRRPVVFGMSEAYFEGLTLALVALTYAGHLAVSIIPMSIFGPINLLLWIYALVEGFLISMCNGLLVRSHISLVNTQQRNDRVHDKSRAKAV